ncbi:MAG TPA: FAD-binding oxidoreductase [Solirubrobacteraceae bacterium]|jgi:glycolate oxidase FAD binding subunit
MPLELRPRSTEEVASELARTSAAGQAVRITGAGTKLAWGRADGHYDTLLCTGELGRIREHNAGDLTAVLEAGVPLAEAQERFASAGQMLALDPWLGAERRATVGGVLATADSGPLSHRYGSPRDLVLGMTVVLADGTVSRSGGQVIKNVAGYDVAKLFCGSFGTLGVIASVNVRLHPLPQSTATAIAQTGDPALLASAARGLAVAPLELEALDLAWENGTGRLLARCGGASAEPRARRAASVMSQASLTQAEVVDDDDALWETQRAGQRSSDGVVIRVAARPTRLGDVLGAARSSGGRVVARAALGQSFVTVEPEAAQALVADLPDGAPWMLLDAPEAVRAALDPWGPTAPQAAIELMHRVKVRFDPSRTCNPGLFVGGI